MDAALRRWEIAGPEVARLLNEYEKCHRIGPEIDFGKHHEDCPAFQKMLVTDVNSLPVLKIFVILLKEVN